MRRCPPGSPQPARSEPCAKAPTQPVLSTPVESCVEQTKYLQNTVFRSTVGVVVGRLGRCYARAFVRVGRGSGEGVQREVELTAERLWSEVAARLRAALNETTYRTWFSDARGVGIGERSFVLGVPNDFTRDWIEGHFLGLIGAAIRDFTGEDRQIELHVAE